MKDDNGRNPLIQFGKYTSLAFLLPASTVVGYGIGILLDRAFGTSFLYIVFLVLGIVGGFIKLIQTFNNDPDLRGK